MVDKKEVERVLEESKETIQRLSKYLYELENVDIKRKDKKIDDLRQKTGEQNKTITKLGINLSTKDSISKKQYIELRQKLEVIDVLNQQILTKNKQISQMDLGLDEQHRKISRQQDSLNRLSNDLAARNKEITQLHDEINPLEKQTTNLIHENRALKDSLKEKEHDKRVLYLKLKEKENDLNEKGLSFITRVEQIKRLAKMKTKKFVEHQTKEKLTLGAKINQLKDMVHQQQNIIKSKDAETKQFLEEIKSRFNNIVSAPLMTEEQAETVDYGSTQAITEPQQLEDNDEIASMIEIAIENKQPMDEIVDSLVSSGYKREKIEEEIKKLS